MKSATTTTKTNDVRLWQVSAVSTKTIHTVTHTYLTTMTVMLM